MFWNLIVQKYEKYHLSHLVMLIILGTYSLLGALCFCAFEAQHEREKLRTAMEVSRRQSALARDRLLYDLQFFFVRRVNVSRLLGAEFHKTLDYYDRLMGYEAIRTTADLERHTRWNIWGGLYFAGTVYTTIGYGDIVTETVAGKMFTVLYAVIGIPLVITVLNIWGNGLFQLFQFIWRNYVLKIRRKFKFPRSKRRRKISGDGDFGETNEDDDEFIVRTDADSGYRHNGYSLIEDGAIGSTSGAAEGTAAADDESMKLPISFAVTLLVSWVFTCAAIFCFFEKWNFLDAAYFFFISLTTIGLGDSIANHKVTCTYFLLILIGLAVVSMSISVIQMKIECLFAKIVKSIDNDFKDLLTEEKRKSMSASIGEERKISANTIAVSVPRASLIGAATGLSTTGVEAFSQPPDALDKYAGEMSLVERLLARMMSRHQRRMLNEKLGARRNMRSVGVQTHTGKSSVFAQTEQDLQAAAAAASAAGVQSAYYSSSDESTEEESTPAPNSFAAMMAAAAVAGRRSASAGPAAGQRINGVAGGTASGAAAAAARRGASVATGGGATGPGGIAGAGGVTRHHRPRGLTRKKLYIYNIGD